MRRQVNFVHIVCGLLCVFMMPGCATEEVKKADDRRAGRTVLIGLIPEQNLFRQIERYDPLAGYLSERTGLHIKLTVLPRYGNSIDNFIQEKLDAAFFGSFTYALAHARLGVQVAVRPEGSDGTSSYRGYIFVRKDSAIRTAVHMRGKRFVFVDRATTAGYLLPLAFFRRHKFKYHDLREVYYSGTHEEPSMTC